VQQPPSAAGVAAATWSWKAVRQFVAQRFSKCLSPRSCLRYLRRLGFVWKRPKRLLLKADPAKRAAFVAQYRALVAAAAQRGAQIFFVDEAHFRADGDVRGLWVLRGQEALFASTSPRWGEKASYYSAVCLETGAVLGWELSGNSDAATSVEFLKKLHTAHPGPLIVIWDNGPAHRGQALRDYLRTPGLDLQLVALPAYSPDYNADELVWKWIREEVTANTCFGKAAKVAAAVGQWFTDLAGRCEEVMRRCRSELQTAAFPETSRHPERREQKLRNRQHQATIAAASM
jgi:transposase